MNILVALVLTGLQPVAAQTAAKNCLGGICIGDSPPFMKGHVEIVGRMFEVEVEACQGKVSQIKGSHFFLPSGACSSARGVSCSAFPLTEYDLVRSEVESVLAKKKWNETSRQTWKTIEKITFVHSSIPGVRVLSLHPYENNASIYIESQSREPCSGPVEDGSGL